METVVEAPTQTYFDQSWDQRYISLVILHWSKQGEMTESVTRLPEVTDLQLTYISVFLFFKNVKLCTQILH